VSIHDGFDFLGWHIKRKKWTRNNKTSPGGETQRTKLIVEPQKKKVKQVMKTLNDQCFTQHNISYSRMIVKCNEIVMGWCIFYRYSYYSQEHFKALQHFIFNRTLHWLCKKHTCSVDSVIKRFCTKKDKPDKDNPRNINLFGVKRRSGKWKYAFRSWVFYTWVHDSINNKSRLHRIYDPTLTREVLVSQHKSGMNPYTTEGLHFPERLFSVWGWFLSGLSFLVQKRLITESTLHVCFLHNQCNVRLKIKCCNALKCSCE
jgi:hypothetical protein